MSELKPVYTWKELFAGGGELSYELFENGDYTMDGHHFFTSGPSRELARRPPAWVPVGERLPER